MKKEVLNEINRTREIMGLNSLLIEQGTRGKETGDVLGVEREKECPCLNDDGTPDGTTSPGCCEEWTEEDQKRYEKFQKAYQSPPSFGHFMSGSLKSMGIDVPEDLGQKYIEELIVYIKNALPIAIKKEKESDGSTGEYRMIQLLKEELSTMEKILKMSEGEFLKLSTDDRVKYARNKQEKEEALTVWNAEKLASDKEWAQYQKEGRIKSTARRDKDYEATMKYANKLIKAFKKKLDRKSLKRWNNKDKAYNEEGWVMTEEDKKTLFLKFRDYFVDWKDVNPKWVKRYKNKDIKLLKEFFSKINLRNVKGPDEVIILEPIETPETGPTAKCSIDLGLTEYGIEDGDFTPFVNNSCEIHQDLKDEVNRIVAELGRWKEANPGVEIDVPDYRIFTSASRARNGGQAAKWSFKELSECRAKSMETYINGAFGTIGVTMPKATIDSDGHNKDGSSGPNPPYPFTMVKGGGPDVVADRKDGMTKGKENEGPTRTKYGAPLPCKPTDNKFICPNYDKYKYCMVDFNIQAWVETIIPEEEPGEPGTVDIDKEVIETRKWQIKFVPRRKHERATVPRLRNPKIQLNFIRVKKSKNKTCMTCCPSFKDLGYSRKFVGIASGKLIDDVVNNGLASYNGTGWLN